MSELMLNYYVVDYLRRQKSEDRNQKAEIRRQKSDTGENDIIVSLMSIWY